MTSQTPMQTDGLGKSPIRNIHTRRIRKITPVQLGKVVSVISFAMSLIFVPIMILVAMMGSTRGNGGVAIGLMVIFPLIYAVAGFVMGFLWAIIYNFVVQYTGGIEIEVE